jgi:hypothetical protein
MDIGKRFCFVMKRIKFLLFLLPSLIFGLEEQPWLGNVYEFNFLGKYSYSYFNHVNNSIPPYNHFYRNNLVYADLEFTFSPQWSIDFDIEFAESTKEVFGYRSNGVQLRCLCLDDMTGDPCSFTLAFSGRNTTERFLHDISCPSHARGDFEGSFSIGKELDAFEMCHFRLWGLGVIGIGTVGSPWLRGKVAFEFNYDDRHKGGIFVDGIHGYGKYGFVDVAHFNGYGKLRQVDIDITFRYGYRFDVWGTLKFEYKRRLLAKVCPAEVNTFSLAYSIPFSF